MEELVALMAMISAEKKVEAQKLADAIKTKVAKLDDEINAEQAKKIDAIKTRDDAKTKLKSISSELGVGADDEIKDVIAAIAVIKTKNTGGDEKAIELKNKEIDNLKAEVKTASELVASERTTNEGKILSVVLEKDIATILPKHKAKVNASEFIMEKIKSQASYVDGKAVFKNADGTTMRINGTDATVDDMIKQMRDKEVESKEGMFFDIGVQKSGNEGGGGGGGGDFVP